MIADNTRQYFCAAIFASLLAMPLLAAENDVDARAPRVTVAVAEINEMVLQTPVTGSLVANEDVFVNTQLNGLMIDEILVEVGDTVRVNEELLLLDDRIQVAQLTQANAELFRAEASKRQANNQVASATANLAQADSVLERAQTLKDSGNISQAKFDLLVATQAAARSRLDSALDGISVATAQIQVAEAQRELAILKLSQTRIRAKVSGVISARSATVGAIAVAGGDPLFVIIRDGLIEVEVEVTETALGDLSIGNEIIFDVAGLGETLGQVRLISPVADPRTRLGKVRASLKPRSGLRAGLFASGWIIIDRYPALTVPVSAVLSDANGEFVQLVVEGKIEQRTVTAGQLWQGRREILTGLSAGEIVLARAGAFFRDGDHVTPVEGDDQ